MLLTQGHQALQLKAEDRTSLLEYLEGVAQVRYALSVVAELLDKKTIEGASTSALQYPEQLGVFANQLLTTARDACCDTAVNHIDTLGCIDTAGPAVYLLKLLVRHHGTHCLQKIISTPTLDCSWVVPHELQKSEEVYFEQLPCHWILTQVVLILSRRSNRQVTLLSFTTHTMPVYVTV